MGSPRSGSTWLLNLLRHDRRVISIDEPGIGVHLGVLMTGFLGLRPSRVDTGDLRLNDLRGQDSDYFFAERFEDVWLPSVRAMILDRLGAQVDQTSQVRDPVVVIKEPHGSQAADVLMAALPRSKLLFLARDGRDVVSSEVDAASAGAWGMERLPGYATADRYRLAYVEDRAHAWLARTDATQRAYDLHEPGRRLMVTYEGLRADPHGDLARISAWLGLDLDDQSIDSAVERLSFERLPDDQRGPGKFARKARAGGWREELNEGERQALEAIIGPKLRQLGYL